MVTPGAFLRVGLLLVLAVVLQLSAVGDLRVLGGHADLIPLTVAAIAYYGGSMAGMSAGFAMGVLVDLVAGQTIGASSLVLTALGYAIGRVRELRDPAHGLLPVLVGAAATLGWVAAFALVSFMLDVGAEVSPLVLRDMLITTLLNTVIALPVFAGCMRVLRPSLRVDPLAVRRRQRPTVEAGPLGLRGLEI